jgi:PhzF family phenazine biosynthesis protein
MFKLYQVDAFTNSLFRGNPAAVCPLERWLNDELLQNIALENNLSETAFYIQDNNRYHIRWFTPETEVDLCGHATLAAAYVLFTEEHHTGDTIHFYSQKSGELTVTKNGKWLSLNFPSDKLKPLELSQALTSGFNISPIAVYKGQTDYLFLFNTEKDIKNLAPDFTEIGKLDCRGIIVTAQGETVDFVSRFFTPQCGINEDPVTGSAHTSLIPFWAKILNKSTLIAQQISARNGDLRCRYLNERVEISGQARLYMTGTIFLE